jgi:DNA topoisomerase-3
MTAFNSRDGGFFLTTVGRVQTPTLSLVVEREEKIRKFISRDYWEIHATFRRPGGRIPRQVVRPVKWKKSDPDDAEAQAPTALWSAAGSHWRLPTPCAAKQATVTEESKPTTQASPAAVRFDQRCNARPTASSAFLPRPRWRWRKVAVRTPQGPDLPAYRFAAALPEDYLPVVQANV